MTFRGRIVSVEGEFNLISDLSKSNAEQRPWHPAFISDQLAQNQELVTNVSHLRLRFYEKKPQSAELPPSF